MELAVTGIMEVAAARANLSPVPIYLIPTNVGMQVSRLQIKKHPDTHWDQRRHSFALTDFELHRLLQNMCAEGFIAHSSLKEFVRNATPVRQQKNKNIFHVLTRYL